MPSHILQEIYDECVSEIYLFNFGVTILPPSSEGKWLSHKSQIYLHFDKDRALILKTFLTAKTFSLRKGLFFVLVLFLVLITAHFHCYTHFPHFRSASNQNTFKVLSLLVFRKTSNIKANYRADCKIFSLQIFQFEKYENR